MGVIYTHGHVDHFGGVRAVASDEDVASGTVRIVAPVDFMTEAISANVMLGNAMSKVGQVGVLTVPAPYRRGRSGPPHRSRPVASP